MKILNRACLAEGKLAVELAAPGSAVYAAIWLNMPMKG
jgi:hypothetical protein